jgi:PAS domain S-box-containing protein
MFNNLKISTKIFLIITLLASASLLSLTLIARQMGAIGDAYSDQVERIDAAIVQAARANRYVVAYSRTAYQLAMEFSDEGNRQLKAELTMTRNTLDRTWEGVRKSLPEYGEQIEATAGVIQKTYALCEGALVEAAATSNAQEVVKAGARLKAQCDPEVNRTIAKIAETVDFLIKEAKQHSADLTDKTNQAIRLATFGMLAGLAAILVLATLIARRGIIQPLHGLGEVVEKFGQKDFEHAVPGLDRLDEIGDLARSTEVMRAEAIKMETERWLKSHVSEISTSLQQAEDFLTLSQTAVSKIAPVMGAGHGAFYVLENDGRYNLRASYGYRERKHLNNSFAVGEGLVGQCVMEKAPIVLTAPKDYIRINSGLGEGLPASIIVQPIIHGERVLGVVEIASFQQFSEREIAVLDALQPILGTSMEILDRNLKTKELLASTQEQAERMEKQAAQLEEQQVEMEAQQAELLETENWFRSIIEAAPDGMLVADANGQILLCNPMVDTLLGYASGELIGGSVEQLVPVHARSGHSGLRAAFMAEGHARTMAASTRLSALCKDGSEIPVVITLSPLPPRGTRGKCVSVSMRKIDA